MNNNINTNIMNNNDNINNKDSGQGKDKGKRKRNGFYNKIMEKPIANFFQYF